MGSIRSIRLANGPQLKGHATQITYDQDEKGVATGRRFTDPDGQAWYSKNVGGHYTAWRFA